MLQTSSRRQPAALRKVDPLGSGSDEESGFSTDDLDSGAQDSAWSIPAVEQTQPADGALASAIISGKHAPHGSVRIDISGVSDDGEYTRIDFAHAAADPESASATFFNETDDERKLFGPSSFGTVGTPAAENLALVSVGGQVVRPVRAGEHSCLCTIGAPAGTAITADRAPPYAMYRSDALPDGKVKLSVAETGEWEIDLDALRASSEVNQN